jgi:hypothetical protein
MSFAVIAGRFASWSSEGGFDAIVCNMALMDMAPGR